MRNGVKSPAKFARSNVEGADVARRSRQSFRHAAADDDQILEDRARTSEIDGICGGGFAAEIFAEVDAPVAAEAGNGFAGRGIERVEIVEHADENARLFSLGRLPQGQTTIGLRANNSGIELPKEFPGGGIEREDFLRGADAVKDAVDDDGAGL